MTEKHSSYRQIIKSTSLFGGVQVFNILISVIRSKFIAVLLGPGGMGIAGLLNSTLRLIEGFSNFGLGTSAVKDVASANATEEKEKVRSVVGILRRLVWLTGSLGALITFVLAPVLSGITFGNDDYTLAYRWLSVTLLFNQLSIGQGVVLRGLRQLKYMARASLLGSLIGLVVSVPVYYLFGIKGIVPAIIASSVISLLLTTYFSRKINIKGTPKSAGEVFREGRNMMAMGFMLSLSGLITLGASYIIRIFISAKGGVDQVGFYNAGFAIINTYVSMVFTAMATDYYPRLSGVAHDNSISRDLINRQAEISILILSPIITIFLVYVNWIVILLYSSRFTEINDMIHWAMFGIYFKAASFSIGYILLARGDSKLFFWNELLANCYILAFNLLGYTLAGLTGLGLSFMAGYFVHLIQVFVVARMKFEFFFEKEFYRIFGWQLLLGTVCLALVKLLTPPWSYITGTLVITTSVYFSLLEIKKRTNISFSLSGIRNMLDGYRNDCKKD